MMNQDSKDKSTAQDQQWASGPLPATYRLVVSGQLGANWRGRLGDMQITVHESSGGTTTVLEGLIRDRAELTGILNTLSDLHLTLLRVEVVEDQP